MLIDFYADWCIPCKELDAVTFSDPAVVEESKRFTPYKVDMTQTLSEETEKIRYSNDLVRWLLAFNNNIFGRSYSFSSWFPSV